MVTDMVKIYESIDCGCDPKLAALLYKARFWFPAEGAELHRGSWILRPASPLES